MVDLNFCQLINDSFTIFTLTSYEFSYNLILIVKFEFSNCRELFNLEVVITLTEQRFLLRKFLQCYLNSTGHTTKCDHIFFLEQVPQESCNTENII